YARRGWAVFPCKPRDKVPATARGFLDASSDPAIIQDLFSGKGDCNIGVATGPASGFWVLDLDGDEGRRSFFEEVLEGDLPETLAANTPGGGLHLFFRSNGSPIKNRAKIGGNPIDVRGAGGYVVVPPSIHPNGKQYAWAGDDETEIAEPPVWLLAYVVGESSHSSNSSRLSFQIGGGDHLDSLGNHPGVAAGQRHDTALRLIGSALGRGLDPVVVAQQAIDWGQRCSPPMADDEVLRVLGDLTRKQTIKIKAVEEEVEAVPLPEAKPWPILDEAAYHGLIGEIVRAIEPESEADPAALLTQTLVSLGSVVGRGPHCVVEGTDHHANINAVLVGKTAKGRKGTSEGRVRQIFQFVDPKWSSDRILAGLVSGEGLVWAVRDPIYKTESVKEKGRIVGTEEVLADPGVDDKRLLVIESEFSSVLRVCRREGNTLSPTIRSAWDGGTIRTLAKNSPARATDAHISVVGHITEEELRRSLAEVDCFSGFANRFLWVLVRRSKLLPDGGRDLDLSRLAERLAYAVETARSAGRMRRDAAAAKLWRELYADLSREIGGLLGAVTSRAEAQVLRLSMIYALADRSPAIAVEHLRAACVVWRYCLASAERIFAGVSTDPVEEQILGAIRQAPGLSRRELHRALGNHVKATVLVAILARLRDAGRVRMEKIPTATKPSERWYPCEQCEQCEQSPAVSPGTSPERGNSSERSHCSQGLRENEADPAMEVIVL
ncbi:MAG: bifunctional DNA primase/polymerase, partial [Pirellulales bacterium]|nr:bifunctional DNA primase/polymerase [Pirellulales bacterium]